jgi:hypothetical protein
MLRKTIGDTNGAHQHDVCPLESAWHGTNWMTESRETGHDIVLRQGAAQFLGQVLGLTDSPEYLAEDLSPIKRDSNTVIYTIQLDSSVGPAAFLVYTYILDERGGDGRTGRDAFDSGLETLRQAAQRSAPGPRALAHAETGAYGFILATTPGTYRALTGGTETGASVEATTEHLLTLDEAQQIRSEAAEHLLEALKVANEHATQWLEAVRIASQTGGDEMDPGEMLEFTDHETELALYLLDDASISNLLQALNVLVSSAQEQAAQAFDDGDRSAPTRSGG